MNNIQTSPTLYMATMRSDWNCQNLPTSTRTHYGFSKKGPTHQSPPITNKRLNERKVTFVQGDEGKRLHAFILDPETIKDAVKLENACKQYFLYNGYTTHCADIWWLCIVQCLHDAADTASINNIFSVLEKLPTWHADYTEKCKQQQLPPPHALPRKILEFAICQKETLSVSNVKTNAKNARVACRIAYFFLQQGLPLVAMELAMRIILYSSTEAMKKHAFTTYAKARQHICIPEKFLQDSSYPHAPEVRPTYNYYSYTPPTDIVLPEVYDEKVKKLFDRYPWLKNLHQSSDNFESKMQRIVNKIVNPKHLNLAIQTVSGRIELLQTIQDTLNGKPHRYNCLGNGRDDCGVNAGLLAIAYNVCKNRTEDHVKQWNKALTQIEKSLSNPAIGPHPQTDPKLVRRGISLMLDFIHGGNPDLRTFMLKAHDVWTNTGLIAMFRQACRASLHEIFAFGNMSQQQASELFGPELTSVYFSPTAKLTVGSIACVLKQFDLETTPIISTSGGHYTRNLDGDPKAPIAIINSGNHWQLISRDLLHTMTSN